MNCHLQPQRTMRLVITWQFTEKASVQLAFILNFIAFEKGLWYSRIKLMLRTMKIWVGIIKERLSEVINIREEQFGFMSSRSATNVSLNNKTDVSLNNKTDIFIINTKTVKINSKRYHRILGEEVLPDCVLQTVPK